MADCAVGAVVLHVFAVYVCVLEHVACVCVLCVRVCLPGDRKTRAHHTSVRLPGALLQRREQWGRKRPGQPRQPRLQQDGEALRGRQHTHLGGLHTPPRGLHPLRFLRLHPPLPAAAAAVRPCLPCSLILFLGLFVSLILPGAERGPQRRAALVRLQHTHPAVLE